ncbi:MAG TPA: hypothetical protein VGF87_02905 [Acidimicrobiales bacterium]|jgi:hypothetical protein
MTIFFGIIAGASLLSTVVLGAANWTRLRHHRVRLSPALVHPAPPEADARLSLVLSPVAVGVLDAVLLTTASVGTSRWALVVSCSLAIAVGEAASLRTARPVPENPLGWQPKAFDLQLPRQQEQAADDDAT